MPTCNIPSLASKIAFTSKIMWSGIHYDPGGTCSLSSRNLNTTALFLISFMMAWSHRSVPDKRSSLYASSTVFGNWIPYWWMRLRYRVLTALIIHSLCGNWIQYLWMRLRYRVVTSLIIHSLCLRVSFIHH